MPSYSEENDYHQALEQSHQQPPYLDSPPEFYTPNSSMLESKYTIGQTYVKNYPRGMHTFFLIFNTKPHNNNSYCIP